MVRRAWEGDLSFPAAGLAAQPKPTGPVVLGLGFPCSQELGFGLAAAQLCAVASALDEAK